MKLKNEVWNKTQASYILFHLFAGKQTFHCLGEILQGDLHISVFISTICLK